MRTPTLAAALLLLPVPGARAEEAPRPPACLLAVIHALTQKGPEVPALQPWQGLLAARAYKTWKSFSLVSQARYRLQAGGKATLAAKTGVVELSVAAREAGVTRATLKVGTRKPVPVTLTPSAPAQLVDGGPWQGGRVLYGLHCEPAAH